MELLKLDVRRPVDIRLSFRLYFRPFIAYLQQQKQCAPPESGISDLYAYLLSKFTPFDSLLQPEDEAWTSPDITELFPLIKFTVLPLLNQQGEIPYAIGLPHRLLTLYHYSEAFEQLMKQSGNLLSYVDTPLIRQDLRRSIYQLILEKCYRVPSATNHSPLFAFQSNQEGITKYYQMRINLQFVEPHLETSLPPLQPSWVEFAKKNIRKVEDLPISLPLEQFTFDGFCLFVIEDITEQAALQELKELFVHLQSESESGIYRRFEKSLRDLCGQADVQVGLTPFIQINGKYVHHTTYSSRSVFLRHSGLQIDWYSNSKTQQLLVDLVNNSQPRILNALDSSDEPEQQILYEKGFRSFILYPIVTATQALGILEIGSTTPLALTGDVLRKIDQAVPMITELLLYQINQFHSNIEKIIRQKFTSLQPSVEWKFAEAAWAYLQHHADEQSAEEAALVLFQKIYPFYGAIDVRNSSTERNQAIQQDLIQQLNFIEEILKLPNLPTQVAIPEELLTRTWHWQSRFAETVGQEDEMQVSDFLAQEIYPYFQHLYEQNSELNSRLKPYFEHTSAATGLYHKAYHAYEQSMAQINAAVNAYIKQEEKQVQAIYPYYFEKFRTDGLEYNLYTGQSIAPWLPFQETYLEQLRTWQLNSMIAMATLTHQLLPSMPLPLQTTQLILAHSQPVDIKFRLDEHRFDVEGSYSIRYEVVKKRIDKAYIKGTEERLTQPDTIAIVYTTSQEIEDYLPAIYDLQQQGKIRYPTEPLELEPLQGITSLKALRLTIQYKS